jgi:hypothetical protein
MELHLAAVGILRVLQILVDETGAVRQPVGRLCLVGDLERQNLACVDLEQTQRRVLVTRPVRAERSELPVLRRRQPRDSGQSGRIEHRRIDEHLVLAA